MTRWLSRGPAWSARWDRGRAGAIDFRRNEAPPADLPVGPQVGVYTDDDLGGLRKQVRDSRVGVRPRGEDPPAGLSGRASTRIHQRRCGPSSRQVGGPRHTL